MADDIYTVRELSFAYGEKPVVSIERLTMKEGIVHVLVGPNGSGKTTFLKLLDGLLEPDKGSIGYRDSPLAEILENKKSIYVHQHPYLFSGTVNDNIAYGLKIRGVRGDELEDRVRRALEAVGLSGFGKRRSGKLSGGEAQRTAIARALVLAPEVLLLDEPTASVDRQSVLRLEEILGSILREYGTTVIVSTHDHPFGYRIADRVIHIEEGRAGGVSENILKGSVTDRTEELTTFTVGPVPIFCPAGAAGVTTAVIDYDQIILSGTPITTSARNTFRGRILDINTVENCVDVRCDIGIILTARITVSSVTELGLVPGREVFVAFKASAVRLY